MHRMRERTATAPDGTRARLGHPRPGRGRTRPAAIHGGPFAQYGWSLFDETQAYVSAGYAVVQCCNPRGLLRLQHRARRAIGGGSASATPTTSSRSWTRR